MPSSFLNFSGKTADFCKMLINGHCTVIRADKGKGCYAAKTVIRAAEVYYLNDKNWFDYKCSIKMIDLRYFFFT